VSKILQAALVMSFRTEARPDSNGDPQILYRQSGYTFEPNNGSTVLGGLDLTIKPAVDYIFGGIFWSAVNGSLVITQMTYEWDDGPIPAQAATLLNPLTQTTISCLATPQDTVLYAPLAAKVGQQAPLYLPTSCREGVTTQIYENGTYKVAGNTSRPVVHGFWWAVLPSVKPGHALVCLDTFINLRDNSAWGRYCVRADQSGNVDTSKVPWMPE
jgi:hypothetical protein